MTAAAIIEDVGDLALALGVGPVSGPRSVSREEVQHFAALMKPGAATPGDLTNAGAIDLTHAGAVDYTNPAALAAVSFNSIRYTVGVDVLAKCAGSFVAGVNKLTSVG